MYVLTRIISQYDGANPFLGIFETQEAAKQARLQYIESVKDNDPWAKQSYRTSNLEQDLQIEKIDDRRTDSQRPTVFLVTGRFEGLGQFVNRFLAVFSDRASAQQYATRAEEGPYETTPNWCGLDEVVVDQAVLGTRRWPRAPRDSEPG